MIYFLIIEIHSSYTIIITLFHMYFILYLGSEDTGDPPSMNICICSNNQRTNASNGGSKPVIQANGKQAKTM
jgi:hypothetical protein